MVSTLRKISSFSVVISPGMRMARPGPGKGCRPTKASGRPSSRPSAAPFALKKSGKRFAQLHVHGLGQAPDIVMRLDGHRWTAGERHAFDHVWIERALRQKLRAT